MQPIIKEIKKQWILPLLTKLKYEQFKNYIDCAELLKFNIVEYAIRDADSLNIFIKIQKYIKDKGLKVNIGIGSMYQLEDVKKYINNGAAFIICPHINLKIAEYCKSQKIEWIPGAATISEIMQAHEFGANIIKVFPIDCLGGQQFIKAVNNPLPFLSLMPTGGITLNPIELNQWYKLNVSCLGIGSNFITPKELNDPIMISKKIKNVLLLLKSIKNENTI